MGTFLGCMFVIEPAWKTARRCELIGPPAEDDYDPPEVPTGMVVRGTLQMHEAKTS